MTGDPTAALAARGLAKRFGERVAVRDVSFTVAPGELVGLVGPNGAGKTTLLSILAGTLAADAGELSVDPRGIGWVPQHAAVYGKLSVAENLRLFARLQGAADVEDAVARMLAQIGLADRAGEPVARLSGGNRQRVNIAIGLLATPAVLLLDEPSASLDPRQRARLWAFVTQLAGAGTAIVFSTHDVAEVQRFAGRVLLLADGELLWSGTPSELAGAGSGDDLEDAVLRFLSERGH